ncbi:MAG: polysaccharide biosynthesis protein [Thermoanaerobaculia bacterium]
MKSHSKGELFSDGPADARWRTEPWWSSLLAKPTQIVLDLVVLTAAFALAYLLRFDFRIPSPYEHRLFIQAPLVVGLHVLAFVFWGVYSFIWRYVGLGEVRAFVGAVGTAAVPLFMLRIGVPETFAEWRTPASIITINAVLALAGTLGLRVGRRVLYERYERRENKRAQAASQDAIRTLLVGAGRAGVLAAREIAGRGDMKLHVCGFVDDDPEKAGSVINGIRVVGRTAEIPSLVAELEVKQVIITIAKASRQELRRIVKICEDCGVRTRIIPGLYEVIDGRVKVSQIRDVDIADLLGRDAVRLDDEGIRRFLAGRRVLVTGAGGSIGSELVRQVARFSPLELLLVERSEYALYRIDEEMGRLYPNLKRVPILADVTDGGRIRDVFKAHKPQVVVHAAAHKHVPLVELNPGEAVKNNVFGTLTVGEIAGEFGAETFLLVSTDKAVNPTSVMGATKRVTELVGQMLGKRFATKYVAVRFGNVLDSAGSVIPRFREQIARGGPVTVTHPEMRRYFMTIPEAAQLVLQAAALGKGGEIFILDMGEPVKIVDLATDLIRLSGFKPHEDIEIVFTGVRPGEKLFEELGTTEEKVDKTAHGKVFVGRIQGVPPEKVVGSLSRLRDLAEGRSTTALRQELQTLIPEATLLGPTSHEDVPKPKPSAQAAEVVPLVFGRRIGGRETKESA